MSLNTAIGRYFQLAPDQLKAVKRTEYRCNVKGCRLGTVVEFSSYRLLIAHASTTSVGEVNASAPAEALEGLTVQEVRSWSPGEFLERLEARDVREVNLEHLYRMSGGDMRQIWYAADETDLQRRSENTFARCRHLRGFFGAEHYAWRPERKVIVSSLHAHRL